MNVWKPIAVCSVAGLVLSLGAQASAAGACHDQPNMAAALDALRAAKRSLDVAEHDKGGWRAKAQAAVATAIAETERGCAWADKH